MSAASQFERLEAAYAELRDAFGAVVVGRHRGEDVRDQARRYADQRAAFAAKLAAHAAGAAPDEGRMLASIGSTLGWMDEMEPVEAPADSGVAPVEAPDVAELRRATFRAFGGAAEAVRVGPDVIDRLTAIGLLATEPDATRRRAIFGALEPIWRAVDGDGGPASPYRRLVRSSAARWARDGSPVEAAATALGMAPGSLEPTLGVHDREGHRAAACRRSWQPATPWIFATYADGGLGNLEELLHESGHALHYAAIRARPALFEPLVEDGGLVEGIADLLGWDVHEPAFQERHIGVTGDLRESRLSRYGWVMLDVCWTLLEIELHRDPQRRPNDAWAELTETGLGIIPHPELSWWALRGQLIDGPGYMANYALSAIVAAALRARIREVRGDWLAGHGDESWFEFVSDRVLRFGASRPAADVLRSFLGGPVTAGPLLDDLAVAAG